MTAGESRFNSDQAQAVFATTRWSVIVSAGQRSSPDADRALELLCHTYWYPLYAFARRRGASPDDAADQTQEFFSRLLEKDFLQAADQQKGRFRSFLLTVFKRFLVNEADRARALKRGGDRQRVPMIDPRSAELRYACEPQDAWTPEALFERRWALTLLEQVLQTLRDDYESRGKRRLFELCQPLLTGSDSGARYAEIAGQLEMNETAVRVAVHRLRARYRELLKREVAQTISETDSVDEELIQLRRAIRGKKH